MSLQEAWERVGISPWRLAVLLVIFMVLWGLSLLVVPCSFGERAVLAEFPQYGGREVGEELELQGDTLQDRVLYAGAPGG